MRPVGVVKDGGTVPGAGQVPELGQGVGFVTVWSVGTGNVVSGVAPRFSSPHVMLLFGAATQPLVGLADVGGKVVNDTGTVVLFDHTGILGWSEPLN